MSKTLDSTKSPNYIQAGLRWNLDLIRTLLTGLLFFTPLFSQITFTWDPNTEPDIKYYRLYQIDTSDTTIAKQQAFFVDSIPHPKTTYKLNSVGNTALYHAWVLTAVDDVGNESKPTPRTPFLAALPPDTPKNFKFTKECCSDSITITITVN